MVKLGRMRSVYGAGSLAVIAIAVFLLVGTLIVGVTPVITSRVPAQVTVSVKSLERPSKVGEENSSPITGGGLKSVNSLIQVNSPNSIYGYSDIDGLFSGVPHSNVESKTRNK